jgi:ribosomal protein S12 methylthiotransferase accessory factor
MTSDLGVPAYTCVILDRPDRDGRRVFGAFGGSGCHTAPAIALLRALTEAVQSRLTFIAGSRDDMYRNEYAQIANEELHQRLWDRLHAPVELEPFSRRESLATPTFEGDLALVFERLRAATLDSVLVVDLTRSEFGIPVVKVVVPGLQGDEDAKPGERGVADGVARS